MTFELVSHTVLVEGAPDRGGAQTQATVPVAAEVLTSNTSPITAYPSSDTTPAWGTWVGTFPRLDVADQSTEYGQATGSANGYDMEHGVGVRNGPWTPLPATIPITARVEFEAWCAVPARWAATVQTAAETTGTTFSSGNITTTPVTGWTTGSLELGFAGNTTSWNAFVAAVAASNIITYLRAFQADGSTLYAGDFRVSKVALKITVAEDTYSVPFGRTGCALLPDGSYIVSVYSDTAPNDLINVWKVDGDGAVLGSVVVNTYGDNDGRMHVTALDGFLVQVLYMTGNYPGGLSLVLDCSGDVPVVVGRWDDPLPTNGYGSDGSNVYSLYNRSRGVVIVQHGDGIALYRRGRPIINRSSPFGGGGSGLFPHPSNPDKCAFWAYSAEADWELEAAEVTIVGSGMIVVESMGFGIPSDDIWWAVGQSSPYTAVPVTLNEDDNDTLTIVEAGSPLNVLWSDPMILRSPVAAEGGALWSTTAWGSALADTANEYWGSDVDGDYAHIGPDQTPGTRVVDTLPAITLPAGQGLAMHVRIRVNSWSTGYIPFKGYLSTQGSVTPLATTSDAIYSYSAGAWQDFEVFFNRTPEVAAALASGNAVVWLEPPNGDTGPSDDYDVSLTAAGTGYGVGVARYAINSDALATSVGDDVDKFAFMHELWHDFGTWPNPVRTQFTIRAGLVDLTSGTPVVDQLDLEYGATSPSGYPDDWCYVSLITGSHSISSRNGELVMATCVVEQEGNNPNYYAVISWKISTGEAGRARLSGTMGGDVWRRGINNASGLLSLQTTQGMLPEASEVTGLDARARPAWMQTSQGRELIGRFTEPAVCLTSIGEAIMLYMDYSPDDEAPYWVGPAPRLSTLDDTSYAHIGEGESHYPAVILPATPCPVGSTVKITYRVRLLGEWTGYDGMGWSAEVMMFKPGFSGFTSNSIRTPAVADGSWQTLVSFIPWTDEIEWWVSEIEAGEMVVGIFGNNTSTEIYDVSYIEACVVPGLPEPTGPAVVDVEYHFTDINADLAAAITLAGPTYAMYGNSWGEFIGQVTPPTAASLVDGSDATVTELAAPNNTGGTVEVFTARLTPTSVVPLGAEPSAVAFTMRGQSPSGDPNSYLDAQVTTNFSTMSIRGQGGNFQLQLPWNQGPGFVTSSHGIFGRYPTVPGHPGRFVGSGYARGTGLDDALAGSDEDTAAWWHEQVNTPGFFLTVQNAATNPAHGPVQITELTLTIRYLVI